MATLTVREREIVGMLADGKTQAQIARELCIAYCTVQTHVENIKQKTATKSAVDIAIKAAVLRSNT